MPDYLCHAATIGPLAVLLALALAGAGPPPQRLSLAIVALALVVSSAMWGRSSLQPAVWCVATVVSAGLLAGCFALTREIGWRLVSDQRLIDEGALARSTPTDRFSLLGVFELTTACTVLCWAAGQSSESLRGFHMPQGASLLTAVLLGLLSAACAASVCFMVQREWFVGRLAVAGAVLLTSTLALEAVTQMLVDLDEGSVRAFAVLDQIESLSGLWWRWTATLTASVVASLAVPLLLDLRWRQWPWD